MVQYLVMSEPSASTLFQGGPFPGAQVGVKYSHPPHMIQVVSCFIYAMAPSTIYLKRSNAGKLHGHAYSRFIQLRSIRSE